MVALLIHRDTNSESFQSISLPPLSVSKICLRGFAGEFLQENQNLSKYSMKSMNNVKYFFPCGRLKHEQQVANSVWIKLKDRTKHKNIIVSKYKSCIVIFRSHRSLWAKHKQANLSLDWSKTPFDFSGMVWNGSVYLQLIITQKTDWLKGTIRLVEVDCLFSLSLSFSSRSLKHASISLFSVAKILKIGHLSLRCQKLCSAIFGTLEKNLEKDWIFFKAAQQRRDTTPFLRNQF